MLLVLIFSNFSTCLLVPPLISSQQWRPVIRLSASIHTKHSEISSKWFSLLKRNSHWGKSKAKPKYIVFQFFHHSVTEGKQTSLMLLILLKALLFFTQNLVLLWLLRNWFLERYLVGLLVSQHDMVRDP